MKKLIFIILILSIIMTGCSKPRDMDSIMDEPNFAGIVEEVYDQSILVRVNEGEEELRSSDLIRISLDAEIEDSQTDFHIGDEVRVYYDGTVAESYPAQISKVYAIVLVNGD